MGVTLMCDWSVSELPRPPRSPYLILYSWNLLGLFLAFFLLIYLLWSLVVCSASQRGLQCDSCSLNFSPEGIGPFLRLKSTFKLWAKQRTKVEFKTKSVPDPHSSLKHSCVIHALCCAFLIFSHWLEHPRLGVFTFSVTSLDQAVNH